MVYFQSYLGRGGNVPPVYAVDGSDKSRWKEEVFVPACEILKHYIEVSGADFI